MLITEEDVAAVPSLMASASQTVPFMVDVATSTGPLIVQISNHRDQPLYFQINLNDVVALVIPPRRLAEHRDVISARLIELSPEAMDDHPELM
jgi:hypothetical protein